MKIELYRDGVGEWRWRAKAANGRTVADSGEGYLSRDDCLHGARLVNPDALVTEVDG